MFIELNSSNMETLDFSIRKETEKEDVIKLIHLIRPEWEEHRLHIEKMKGGIVNTMYCCRADEEVQNSSDGKSEKIVVRIYPDHQDFSFNPSGDAESDISKRKMDLFDHKKEIDKLQHLKGTGIAPELIALFKNGLCYRYLSGVTLDCSAVRSEDMIPHVSKLLARLHSLPLIPKSFTWDLDDVKIFAHIYPPQLKDAERTKKLIEVLPDKETIFREIETVKKLLEDVQSPLVFGHNDSKAENFIWDENTGNLSIIDFEHSANIRQAEELASHFVLYNDVTNSKPDQYPCREFQLRWLKMYLSHWYEFTGKHPEDITENDIEALYVNLNKCAQKTRLMIGVGCLSMAALGLFDTFEFCLQLLKDYFHYKDYVHGLVVPSTN